MNSRILFPLVAGSIFMTGCDTISFRIADSKHTVEAYQAYLDKNPQGARRDEALQALDTLTFVRCEGDSSVVPCSLYVSKFPKGAFVGKAIDAMASIEYRGLDQDSIQPHLDFIARHQGNRYADTATAHLSRLYSAKYGFTSPVEENGYATAEYSTKSLPNSGVGGIMWAIRGDTLVSLIGDKDWKIDNQNGFVLLLVTKKTGDRSRVSCKAVLAKDYPIGLTGGLTFVVDGELRGKQASIREALMTDYRHAGIQYHKMISDGIIAAEKKSRK